MQIGEAILIDEESQTDHEVLASGRFILIRDIKLALDGEDFNYIESSGGGLIYTSGVDPLDWNVYFNEYRRWKKFGLPHGKGSEDELPWLPDFLLDMDDTHKQIEAWNIRKGG